MSQPDTELDPGEDTLDSIAEAEVASLGDGGEGQDLTDTTDTTETLDEIDPDTGEPIQPQATQDDDPEIEWEAGGAKFKVKRSELQAGYMKDSDYRQKTAKVAERQRELDAIAHQVHERLQFAANHVDVYVGTLHRKLIGSQPDPRLIDEDLTAYLQQKAVYDQNLQEFQQALQQRQAIQGQMSAEEQRRQAAWQQQESEKLLDALPEWKDEKVQTAEAKEIADYLFSRGFTAAEIGGLFDHRTLLVARDAAKARARETTRTQRARQDPPRAVRAGAATGDNPNQNLQRAAERLRRDPNDLDALVAYEMARGTG